jgi:serine/threonine protein kinase
MNESKESDRTADLTLLHSDTGHNETVDHHVSTVEPTLNHNATLDHKSTVDEVDSDGNGGKTIDHEVPAADGVSRATPRKRTRELPIVPGYEILSVLGRGGMGVVYKARQTRLNRLVALKMILAGGHASPQQLTRFDQEAKSVARLQHPNIVQIYEIGELEGLPYFSLEFVDGGTLDTLIDRHPQPPRTAAEIVETLARAMQFAHEQNIVHRDLKPANILLTRSTSRGTGSMSLAPGIRSQLSQSGESLSESLSLGSLTLKITDFGLAKAVEEGGTNNTVSGTILGTPSYMSPEQAHGEVAALGPLCDLYSLGAILYELLTGRPPFQSASILETLDQVRNREPVPIHHLQPNVPPDLETICLKCLQKEAAKRYVNCGELADDLARYLAGHPILARPISGPERFWRWCRRNPRIAGLTAASVLFLVCTAVVSTWAAIAMSAKNTEIAGQNTEIAAQNTVIKLEKEEAEIARKVAVAAEKVAAENSKLASEQAAVALSTLQKLIAKVQNDYGLTSTPETLEFKRSMLQTALEGAQQVSKRGEGSTSVEATQAAAHMQLGVMFKQLGKSKEAMAEFRRVYEIAKARVDIKKGTDASRRNLAAALLMLAEMDKELDRNMQAALTHIKESLALFEDIDRNPKSDEDTQVVMSLTGPAVQAGIDAKKKSDLKDGWAEVNTRVGVTYLRLGAPVQAIPYFRKSLAIRRELSQANSTNLTNRLHVARSLLAMGDSSFRVDDRATTNASFDESLGIVEDVYKRLPKSPTAKHELARASSMRGDSHLRAGEYEKARLLYDRALVLTKEILAVDSKKFEYQWDLGHAYYRLGLLAIRANDSVAAKNHFESCLTIRENLAKQDSGNDRRQMEFMLVLAHCGKHIEAAAIATKLLTGLTDNELLVDVARCYAQCAANASGDEAQRQSYFKDALQAIERSCKQGYRDVVYLGTEVDFDPLRTQDGFRQLLDSIRRNAGSSAFDGM